MSGYIDLHCHYVPGIDDGARSIEEGAAILVGLKQLGFERVIATPHMRPGMFNNAGQDIRSAFNDIKPKFAQQGDVPELDLACEHYFDDVVFERIVAGEGVPYPGGKAVLLEFYEQDFPPSLSYRFFDLRRRGLRPVIAHPERYRKIWKSPETLARLIEGGAVALLDTAALVGKYGRKPQKCAETLLERELYHAACSDAHRPADVAQVGAGMEVIAKKYGGDELEFLFRKGPASILLGGRRLRGTRRDVTVQNDQQLDAPKPRRLALKLFLSLLLAGAFVYLLHRGALPLVPSREAFATMRWWTIPAYVATWCVVHTLRAVRWRYLLAPIVSIRVGRILSVSFLAYAAIAILPFRTGEVVRPVLIARRQPISAWQATGTVGAERVIDGLVLSAVLFVGLLAATPLSPLPERIGELPIPVRVIPGAAKMALAVFFAAFVTMAIFYVRRDFARRATERTVGVVSKRLATWLADRVEAVADGLKFLPQWRQTLPFLLQTLGYWGLNAAGILLLAKGCGLSNFGYVEACVTMGVLGLGILVPNSPGFFGAFQVSVYAGLAMFSPPSMVMEQGAALVFVMYVVQLGITLIAGLAGAWGERLYSRQVDADVRATAS